MREEQLQRSVWCGPLDGSGLVAAIHASATFWWQRQVCLAVHHVLQVAMNGSILGCQQLKEASMENNYMKYQL